MINEDEVNTKTKLSLNFDKYEINNKRFLKKINSEFKIDEMNTNKSKLLNQCVEVFIIKKRFKRNKMNILKKKRNKISKIKKL